MPFDPSAAALRHERLWTLPATFGMERNSFFSYLHEIVRDRYVLVNGLQLLRDELQIATLDDHPLGVCATDITIPSVLYPADGSVMDSRRRERNSSLRGGSGFSGGFMGKFLVKRKSLGRNRQIRGCSLHRKSREC